MVSDMPNITTEVVVMYNTPKDFISYKILSNTYKTSMEPVFDIDVKMNKEKIFEFEKLYPKLSNIFNTYNYHLDMNGYEILHNNKDEIKSCDINKSQITYDFYKQSTYKCLAYMYEGLDANEDCKDCELLYCLNDFEYIKGN
jgi:hypothetical protein